MQRSRERVTGQAEHRGPEHRDRARASAQSTTRSDGHERTQTDQPQSGGTVIDPAATEEFGTGRGR